MPAANKPSLDTLGEIFRVAVRRFRAARLAYGHGTTNAYDELNRLKQITDPANGITQFGYDANDNLTSVNDPRGLATGYSYSGFGDLKTQVSPDTGTTTNTYDSGGSLATSTDARGAVATYGYDALNRVKTMGDTVAAQPCKGLSWTYDAWGNLTNRGALRSFQRSRFLSI